MTPIPRPKDECYLYMPNPTRIHPHSAKTNHFLGIADVYLRYGQPKHFLVEPELKGHPYQPDAYMIYNNKEIVVELQLSHTSEKKIQEKVDNFVDSGDKGYHSANTLWIISDLKWKAKIKNGYSLEYIPWTMEENEKGLA